MRKKAATKRSKSSTVNKLNRQLMLVSLNYIAEKNVNEKQKNDGRIPWGFVARLLKEGKETFPSMSMRTVNNYVKRIEKRSGTVIKPTRSILVDKNSATNITTISSLTGDSEAATKECVSLLSDLQREMKREGRRLRKGAIKDTITQCAARHNLPPSDEIKTETVKQRLKRKTTKGNTGNSSPMETIEPYIVSIIIQLSNMHIPITILQGLQLCNSIIMGTKFKEQVDVFKRRMCRSATPVLGRGYWRGFLKRNKHLISSKKAVKFDTKRAEWCTYLNMKEMYDEVYTSLVDSGLAIKHDVPVWRNDAGEVVNKENSVGCESKYELVHPNLLLFVDEVGSNTSQAKDGNVGGEKFLCTKHGRPQQ